MPDMTIAKFAAAGGVGVETIRYYQRRGLLAEPPRAGTVRRYGREDVRRLLFIRRAQAAGFTLDEIGELLALDKGEDRARVRALAAARLEALEAKIAELESARAALTRLSRACAGGGSGALPDPGGLRGLEHPMLSPVEPVRRRQPPRLTALRQPEAHRQMK